MSTTGYYNYDGVWLAASATPTKYVWGVSTETLTAGTGAYKLVDSGAGQDMVGGNGDDTFVVGNTSDVVTAGATGVDTIIANVNFTLPAGIQNMQLNGEWNNVVAVGNAQADVITADRAGETIVAGTGDSVFVAAGGDTIIMQPGAGKDVIVNFHAGATNSDIVRLDGYGFTSFAAVQGAMTQQGSDVILKLSSTDLIDFRNTTVSAFTADNFQLGIDLTGKTMSFDEDFNNLSLYSASNPTGVWKTNYIWGDQKGLDSHTITGDGEQEVYVDPTFAGTGSTALGINPFSISNGVLTINAQPITSSTVKSDLWNYDYTSGLLSTQKSFSQTYGYFEIKCEMPTTPGLWPAFWMMPADGSGATELDIFEEIGDQPNTIYNTVHYTPAGSTTRVETDFTTYVPNLTGAYHTYGMLWTPTTITFYVDGVAVGSTATPADMNKPMYMVVNLAVGGQWPGDPAAGTTGQLNIDYIHAYTLAQIESGATSVSVPKTVAPTTKADAYSVHSGASITVAAASGVLANDTDNNGQTLNATLATNGGPSHGVLTLNADGSFTYTPNLGFAGTDSFTYIASDTLSAATATTVTLTVVDPPPTSTAETYVAHAGSALTVSAAQGVLANDVDNNGLTLTAALATNGGPAHGTLVLNADGSFTYTPNAGYVGTDSFTYIASDSLSPGNPTTVTLNVGATAPTTKAEAYAAHTGATVTESAAQGVLANDTDNNGLTLTAALANNGGPAHGTLVLNSDGSFTYTANAGYVGTDSFTYIASDSLSSGAPTTVTLNVTATAPTVKANVYAATAGSTLTESAAQGVLANDVDNNGLTLTATLANNGGPSHGTLVLDANGSFTYTANVGYVGTDSFTYIASDGVSTSAPTTVTLNVGATAPTTTANSYTAAAGGVLTESLAKGVLANDVDNNGLPLSASLATNGGPAHGTVTLNADGSFTYTPNLGFVGTDSFTYVASDSLSNSPPTTVTINVAATAPTVKANAYTVAAGSSLTEAAAQGVLANDVDNNGLKLTAALASNGGPAHGTLVLNADGSFTYTPNAGFAGTDSFTYIASDSLSSGTPTMVTLNVGATAPTAKADSYAAVSGKALTETAAQGVLANDVDNNGLKLTAALAKNGGPAHGTLVLNADGSFTYTPTAGYVGTDSFTYVASDSLSSGAATTVTLNVAAGTTTASTSTSTSTGSTAPVITGGKGNDTYNVSNSAEQIKVAAGTPNETVIATVNYVLPANIQTLVMKGTGLTGTANSGTDTLTSLGGPNTLVAGSGLDTFNVNNINDKVVISASQNSDVINSTVNYTLPTNAHVLALSASGLTGVGNAAGYNYLISTNGGDTLVGSAKGHDTFIISHSNDVIQVAATAVGDVVNTYASYTLPANVQKIVAEGANALTLVGNSAANTLVANKGADTLTGGGGADTFVMAPGEKMETITDFSTTGGDQIDISAYLAKGLNPTFHDFGTYSTVTFTTGETIKLLGVHASALHVSGAYIV